MEINIETEAKEVLGGTSEYKRLIKFLFWLEEKLEILPTTKLDVTIVNDTSLDIVGTVNADSSSNLRLLLNTRYAQDKNILNPITGRYEDWFATAAHEMVHVKQWNSLQLVYSGSYYWDSKRYHSIGDKLSYQEYKNLPWETEAFSRQDELYQEWLAAGEPHSIK